MKMFQYVVTGTLLFLFISVEFGYALTNTGEDSTYTANMHSKQDDGSILVIKVWGTEKGQPGISFDNQTGKSGTLPLQCKDAFNPDVATVGSGINKFLVVAYYSPQSNSYLAEYFEWTGISLISTGTPEVIMTKVNEPSSIKVEGNYSGEFSIEIDCVSSVQDTDKNITGGIDPVTGLPMIILAPRVNYLINYNYE